MSELGSFISYKNKKASEIKPCLEGETPIGRTIECVYRDYRIHYSIFTFKFDWRGLAINFCIKYNIPLKNEYKREDWLIVVGNGWVFNE